jgi:hypothetical protein
VAANVNPAASLTYTYTRWDGRIPYTPVPADLTSVTGATRDSKLDPSLKGEYLDEFTGGVDLGLWKDTSIRLNYVHKRDYRGNKVLNLAQPYSAYTDVANGIDPGRDNVVGTADDRIVQVYSVPRSYPTFGQIQELTVNAAPGEGDDRYNAFEATFSKTYSQGWSFLASYTADHRDAKNIDPRTPNEALYGIGTTGVWALPENYQGIRLSGTYELPWQMLLASTFTAQQGEYFNRVVQVRDALNVVQNLTVEGQAGRYDWVKLADLRVSKSLRLGPGTFEGMVDCFNLFNSSVVLRRVTTNGPNYNKPLSTGGIDAASANPIPAARVFRISFRYRF